jgi:hypothetical protein
VSSVALDQTEAQKCQAKSSGFGSQYRSLEGPAEERGSALNDESGESFGPPGGASTRLATADYPLGHLYGMPLGHLWATGFAHR